MSTEDEFDPISLEILWSRLIGIADDMWTTVLRTAVSTIIGAAQDFGCEILDVDGGSVAHAGRSMPVFNMVMPTVTRAVLVRHPLDTMRPGDVFVTNDPWLCAGHLDDIAVVTPVFRGGAPVAFATTVAHASSIGGALASRGVHDVYEEGLRIPVTTLYVAGEADKTTHAFIHDNVREPELVFADIDAQLAANRLATIRLVAFLEEYGLSDLRRIARVIQLRSELAMRKALGVLPDGVYEHAIEIDGLETSVRVVSRVTISGESIAVDYKGTEAQRPSGGINCTLSYTRAHTVYPLQCMLCPSVPANEGTFRPITISAPEGSILNCTPPASVGARVRTGWHLHPLLFGALADILPDRVQAGNGLMHMLRAYGERVDGGAFSSHFIAGGGRGASLAAGDGIGRNCFPSSARNVAIEDFELRTPVTVWSRSLRQESSGAGQWRGAPGTSVELGITPGHTLPVDIFVDPDYLVFGPRGIAGGEPGRRFGIEYNGAPADPAAVRSGRFSLRTPDERLTLHFPGGGGYGPQERRDSFGRNADRRWGYLEVRAP